MKNSFRWILLVAAVLLTSCGSGATTPTTTPASDLDAAEHALKSFFIALSQHDYKEAATYHLVPNALVFLYEDIDPEDAEALLARACARDQQPGCKFKCWRIRDITQRWMVTPDEYVFKVRFENTEGELLVSGQNVTPQPCLPPDCVQGEYSYQVVKIEGKFYVDGIPVFTGCWP